MNKNWIITALVLYLVAVAALGSILLNRKSSSFIEPPPVQEKKSVPHKSAAQPVAKDYTFIVKNDLFHPFRGKENGEPAKTASKRTGQPGRFKFDLRGVFRSGDKFGALISISGNAPTPKGTLKKADREVFFQGAEIAEGYILQKVDSHGITILHNGETIVVELEKMKTPEMPPEKESNDKLNAKNKLSRRSS